MLRNNRSIPRRRDRGFTLIEVLVAFAILAISLTVLTRTFSTGLDAVETSERYTTATLLARSTLEQVGIAIPVATGEIARDAGNGFRVILRIAPATSVPAAPVANGLATPYVATVTVQWPGGAMSLTTLRIALESADANQRSSKPATQGDQALP